jgi:hypothetical protein
MRHCPAVQVYMTCTVHGEGRNSIATLVYKAHVEVAAAVGMLALTITHSYLGMQVDTAAAHTATHLQILVCLTSR